MKFLICQQRPTKDGQSKFVNVALFAEAPDALHAAAAMVRQAPGQSTQVWRRGKGRGRHATIGIQYSIFSCSRAEDVAAELSRGLGDYKQAEKRWRAEQRRSKACIEARGVFANRFEFAAFMAAREDEAFKKLYWSDDDPTFAAAEVRLRELGVLPLEQREPEAATA